MRPSSLFSGNAPIVTAPASEDEDVAKDVVEDENDDEERWLFNQVVDLLRIMHERVNQQTWNERDKELIDGLNNISVMHLRLGRLTEKMLKGRAKKPDM